MKFLLRDQATEYVSSFDAVFTFRGTNCFARRFGLRTQPPVPNGS
jgi:hypothetical protein